MLKLMEEGNLSKEEVIEHLINNGFLPVEVTELGKLPISVGKRVRFREELKPLNHGREEITSERFKELTSTSRVPFDERRNKLEIRNNPNFDFERINTEDFEDFGVVNSPNIRIRPFVQSARQEEPKTDVTIITTTESSPNTTTFLKVDPEEMEKIEAVMTMIKMFENDQISEDELIQMMAQMSDEIIGDDNPITEFSVFNDDNDMPVKSSFFNMNRPVQSSQEKPPIDPIDATNIMFPGENVDTLFDPFKPDTFNPVPSESPKPSIKPFTSFGTKFNKDHNNFGSISGVNPPHQPTTVVSDVPGPPHTLFYDDLSNQQIEIKLPNNFPDFNSFDLQHKEYLPEAQSHLSYLPPPPSPVVPIVPVVTEKSPKPYYHYPEVHQEEHYAKHHYEETYSTYPYDESHHVPNSPPPPPVYHLDPNGQQIYQNVNDRPLHFDEMTHKEFSPELPSYNGPREPFGPPASIIPQFTPEFRELPAPESRLPSYVKSLPDYPPPAYGAYNTEGYSNYEQPTYYNSYTPNHSPDSHHKPHHYDHQYDHQLPQQYLPTAEYIPSEVVHQQEPEYPSPLYLHHGPGGYEDIKNHPPPQPPPQPPIQHEVIEVPIYTPKDTYYPDLSQEYGLRKPRELIPDLPDHRTDKPFAYEDLPLSPITGHREIDRNIEDIHRAFREGDALMIENTKS